MGDIEEEFVVILSSKAVFWLSECPLPIWHDPEGGVHYLRGVFADNGRGSRCMCFIERPMPAAFEGSDGETTFVRDV